MDNRRFSARADIGMTGARRSDPVRVPWLDRAVELTRLNWETIAFVGLMLVALFTRLWDLAPRAMHHDESIHAYFSNLFLKSGDYTTDVDNLVAQQQGLRDPDGGYDPVYHGPFLYFATGLSFFLFGTNDFTARLMPAIFGVILVGLIWLLRPFIGRISVLVAALMVILSPSISYYSRSLRHDIFALTGTLLLFVSILWFMRTHQAKWVYLGSLGLVVAYSSHELTFIIAFIFLVFLAIAAFAFPSFAARVSYVGRVAPPEPVNPVRSALSALSAQRWTLAGAALLFLVIYVVLFTNMLTKPWLIASGITEGFAYWTSQHGFARGDQPVFYYFLLMLIYEPLAFLAGFGTIGYMIVKWAKGDSDSLAPGNDVDVEPEPATVGATDQYGVPLPAIEGLRGLTLAFLAFWSLGAFIAFSLAGERMPWLNMQSALPFTLLAGAGLGLLITRLDWRQAIKGGGVLLGASVVLFIFTAFSLMAHLSDRLNNRLQVPGGINKADFDFQMGVRAVSLFIFAAALLGLASWLSYKMMPGRAIKVVALTFSIVLLGYGLRSMMLVDYRHSDVPIEMLIYTQSSPDVPIVADMIKRLSRDETSFDATRNADDVTGGHSLSIIIDENQAIAWPFNWYFRDMKKYTYFKADDWKTGAWAQKVAPDQAVILASDDTEPLENFQSFIKDKYTTIKYPLNWWFPEENTYKKRLMTTSAQGDLVEVTKPVINEKNEPVKDASGKELRTPIFEGDLGMALQWLTGNGMKYILYRDLGRDAKGNEFKLGTRNFYLHIRNDIAYKAGLAAPPGGTSAVGTPANPDPESAIHKMTDVTPGGFERGQFKLPRGIATAPDGSLYVVDTANMRLQKFDSKGIFQRIIGGITGRADGEFNPREANALGDGPSGIAVDKAGNIYVADTWNHRIQKFDSNGKFATAWGGELLSLSDPNTTDDPSNRSKLFYGPRGVAVGPDNNVYVTDTGNKRVMIFDPTGRFVRQISSGLTAAKSGQAFNGNGEMNEPVGIAVDNSGNVFVADRDNRRIQKFDKDGKFVAQWPVPDKGYDTIGANAEPFLALDTAGNLYTTLPGTLKVAKYSPDGKLLGEKANEGAATLKDPTGITVAADGTIYVVDRATNVVINFGKMP